MSGPKESSKTPRPACFLDRDGVLIEEVNYLASPGQVALIKGAAEALRKLRAAGHVIIVVTNQAGVAKGYFREDIIPAVHSRIHELLADGGASVDGFYYCPHHPSGKVREYSVECSCRKPEPGMILRAASELNVDLASSFMIGDKISDLEAAANAGCRAAALVRTGHGGAHAEKAARAGFPVFDDIAGAVDFLLGTAAPAPR
jgi:D-glycero-D-manno-heptose 1,7-bisphosphate phosphatase